MTRTWDPRAHLLPRILNAVIPLIGTFCFVLSTYLGVVSKMVWPLGVFWLAYAIMFHVSKQNPVFAQYTIWIYASTLMLVPFMHYRLAKQIAFVNTFGMGFGIHMFYAVTGYRLLQNFGANNGIHSFAVLILIDFAVHWLPFVAMSLFFAADLCGAGQTTAHLWIGFMTGLCHSTYTYFLGYGWDPGPLYNVTIPYSIGSIYVAWVGLLLGHVMIASWLR